MTRLLHSPIGLLVRRIALVYTVLMLCRLIFWLYNARLLDLAWPEAAQLLRGALLFDTASVVYANGAFVLLSLLPLPAHIRSRGWWRALLYGYYVTVNALLVVAANLADAVYFRYTQKRFTADEIFFADNDNSLALVLRFAAENWYLVLAAAALTALLARGYGRHVKEEPLLREGWASGVGRTLLLLAGGGLCVAGMRGGFTRMTRPITLSNATLYASDNAQANLILSNPFCILRTVGSTGKIRCTRYFAPGELDARFTPVHEPADSAAVDLSGRNVMIFIMESMSAEHSARLCPEVWEGRPERGMTPFLDSLMDRSLTFRRMYANGTRSIQAMPSVLGSIPSLRTPFVLMPQSLGASRQLPAMLAARGYATLFFCGSERGSMGFGAYARSAGIERLVSREDYEERHGAGDFDGYWGIWDEPFIGFAGEELAATPEPFFATLFTLTAHHPFVVPERDAAALPGGYTPVHRGVAYDDRALRRFFERFSDEEWFRRTIFVFVADHVSSEKFAAATHRRPGNLHIVGFIHTPDGALEGQVEDVAQQLDIMPTLLGLLGNRERYFAFGRDVLNEPSRPCWSVGYDGGRYYALTREGEADFDERTPADTAARSTLGRLQAFVQQYYTRIERQDYTAQ
ncbi:LTA synthase family protein [uncultured Alistipes sp.]|uniref:LTA synthase family protein n=1 Tax=uncultured Alistipes sp. TaxID=538949 RepID=UPI0026245B97|nr:LTA synthase family protein [uncultured Alistipes sp.]